jgi:LemA protein
MIDSTARRVLDADPARRGAVGKGCAVGGGLVVALLVLVLGLGGCVWSKHTQLVGSRETVSQRLAEVDNQYRRRNDLVDNLVSTVRGAANFEQSTLREVTEARASVSRVQLPRDLPTDPVELQNYINAQAQLGGALTRLLAVAENYPQLRATEGFRDLQAQLEGTENRITVARRDFIEATRNYNTQLKSFPGNVIGSFFGFQPAAQFEAAPEERAVPKVDFGDFGGQTKKQ